MLDTTWSELKLSQGSHCLIRTNRSDIFFVVKLLTLII